MLQDTITLSTSDTGREKQKTELSLTKTVIISKFNQRILTNRTKDRSNDQRIEISLLCRIFLAIKDGLTH